VIEDARWACPARERSFPRAQGELSNDTWTRDMAGRGGEESGTYLEVSWVHENFVYFPPLASDGSL
jgi:hypothetical protein